MQRQSTEFWCTKRGGAVLILVVAVLALIALIGTVYIISARTERASSRATSDALNLDLARDAVMAQVRTLLYESTLDANGNVGGLSSRFYDYPDGQTQRWLASGVYPNGAASDFSLIADKGFNPTTGAADITVPTTFNVVGDPNHSTPDAGVYLLSFSGPAGERYRFGVRIVDAAGMANLNTGSPADVAMSAAADPFGRYLSSYALNAPLDASRHPKVTTPFDAAAWQTQMMSIERTPATDITLFDLSDELELRSYGTAGTSYTSRAAAAWPSGLSAGQPTRNNFTTYSFTRDLRLRPDPSSGAPPFGGYTVTATGFGSGKEWPNGPAKAWMNPAVDNSSAQSASNSMFNLAVAATNAATAMELSGFSPDEARAFAANYLTYRWNGVSIDGGAFLPDETPPASGAYFLPSGPSFVDDGGVCVRAGLNAQSNFGGPGDLKGAGKTYLGYAPQPFINEVAAMMQYDATSNAVVVSNVAVELYNPYPVALSLRGFKFYMQGHTTTPGGQEPDLTGYYVPAHGFFTVIAHPGDAFAAAVKGERIFWDVGQRAGVFSLHAGGGTVVLTRSYYDRAGSSPTSDGAIDAYPYDTLVTSASTIDANAPHLYYLRRSNAAYVKGTLDYWQAAVHGPGAAIRYDGAAIPPTLGDVNPTDAGAVGVDLSDRYSAAIVDGTLPALKDGDAFRNFADFNGILRICNQTSTPPPPAVTLTTAPAPVQSLVDLPLSAQLAVLLKKTPAAPLDRDALVHFDFKANAQVFAPGATVPPAVQLFDYITLVDRCYDASINVGTGPITTVKLRLPGRINVNTANRDVLLGIPAPTSAVADSILAYRDRQGPFRDSVHYPGHGIRTLAEMLVPVTMAAGAPPSPQTLAERDKVWASLLTLCTTRSDTFVVYAYMEAVKQNPSSTATFDNANGWYGTGTAVTDDPHNASAPLLRVARRRWVAIVDRSFCNAGRNSGVVALPLVVAMKDLSR